MDAQSPSTAPTGLAKKNSPQLWDEDARNAALRGERALSRIITQTSQALNQTELRHHFLREETRSHTRPPITARAALVRAAQRRKRPYDRTVCCRHVCRI